MEANNPHFMTVVAIRDAEAMLVRAREALYSSIHASVQAAACIRSAQESLANAACALTSTAQKYPPKVQF